jgi:hypothetical protein
MNKKSFFRSQAALCQRIARNFPQERIAAELMRIAADFEAKAEEGGPGDAGGHSEAPAWSISPTGSLRTRSAVADHLVELAFIGDVSEQEQGAGERPSSGDDANHGAIR